MSLFDKVTTPEAHRAPYLTETVVFGMHLYRSPGDDSSVYFVDEASGIRKMLVDSRGNIQNFPGIVKEDFWTKEVSPNATDPQICFRTEFNKRLNGWIMLWTIQPDGRYWADDDGFGWENDPEVILYTYVDQTGSFTGPFRIYSLGAREFTLDRFEIALSWKYPNALQMLKDGDLDQDPFLVPEDLLFPRLSGLPTIHGSKAYYTLRNREEALAYWAHPVLSKNLIEATEVLISLNKPVCQIAGLGEEVVIHASMTLFFLLTGEAVFKAALDKFFEGKLDQATVEMLSNADKELI